MDGFDFNITIVGLGLIGGSYAMALKELKPKNLWAVDIDKEAIEIAQRKGIIDKGYTDVKVPLKDSDIIILCVYPALMTKFIKENMQFFKKGAIITDVAGTKETLIKEINRFLRKDLDFIGGHPMAGREYKGLSFASKDIFVGANYILTPTPYNKKENIALIEKIVKGIGCKNIMKISAKKHDEIMAYTSQLPHIMAAALMKGVKEETHLFVAGSFRDATRVARLNGRLWADLLIDNQENTIEKIEEFEEYVGSIKNAIINKDHEELETIFEDARIKREEFIKKCQH
ncbi:prephenate dehydrogenase [Crassaminicella profunda]|uniref:prephenate dehydrogenase n=1 Tax=Crassaminicella profunda TaxID=1286698 RepID=UPI001CA71A21|nr:prephenate dehydrogenase [Crassaminicella profunda]QZY53644.1 prephenate dehydrogenase [Crassaminicella profunda]